MKRPRPTKRHLENRLDDVETGVDQGTVATIPISQRTADDLGSATKYLAEAQATADNPHPYHAGDSRKARDPSLPPWTARFDPDDPGTLRLGVAGQTAADRAMFDVLGTPGESFDPDDYPPQKASVDLSAHSRDQIRTGLTSLALDHDVDVYVWLVHVSRLDEPTVEFLMWHEASLGEFDERDREWVENALSGDGSEPA